MSSTVYDTDRSYSDESKGGSCSRETIIQQTNSAMPQTATTHLSAEKDYVLIYAEVVGVESSSRVSD